MKHITYCFFLLTFLFSTTLSAQLKETIHQTFDIDDAKTVSIDLVGEYEIVKWPGNTILTHTYIELSDARPSILSYYLKEGRYEIEGTGNGDQFTLVAKDRVRRPIMYKKLECYEYTKIKISIPDDFVVINNSSLVREEAAEE